ncbi:hypothetical protein C1H46_035708 [Malus baccata]|uniref:Uncharacterized protein n=1 Tax=Malus baccata TaxID=106549 RepID=A0A540KXD6_MALBA|nr:hypothetical protein C1H46_035708 [Malus baccata]
MKQRSTIGRGEEVIPLPALPNRVFHGRRTNYKQQSEALPSFQNVPTTIDHQHNHNTDNTIAATTPFPELFSNQRAQRCSMLHFVTYGIKEGGHERSLPP